MSGYILRHKLKNPAYASDSNHQWFNIVDIFNNGTENEIHLHGILKDKDSVSTNNIEDDAVTAIKTDFKIVGGGHDQNTTNYLQIEPGTINADDLTAEAYNTFTSIVLGEDSVGTLAISQGAVTEDELGLNAVTTDKIKNGSVTGDKLATKLLGVIVSTAEDLTNMFDSTRTGALSDWDQNHLGIWIKI